MPLFQQCYVSCFFFLGGLEELMNVIGLIFPNRRKQCECPSGISKPVPLSKKIMEKIGEKGPPISHLQESKRGFTSTFANCYLLKTGCAMSQVHQMGRDGSFKPYHSCLPPLMESLCKAQPDTY